MTGAQEPFSGQSRCQPVPQMSTMVHSAAQGEELNGESDLSFNLTEAEWSWLYLPTWYNTRGPCPWRRKTETYPPAFSLTDRNLR